MKELRRGQIALQETELQQKMLLLYLLPLLDLEVFCLSGRFDSPPSLS